MAEGIITAPIYNSLHTLSGNELPPNEYGTFDNVYSGLSYNATHADFQIRMTVSKEIPSYKEFFKLPDNIHPSRDFTFPIYANDKMIAVMRLQTNGYIRPEVTINSGTAFEGSISFIRGE